MDKAFRNVVRHAKSYSMRTRAWDAIHRMNGAVQKQAAIYKQCRKAMVVLGAECRDPYPLPAIADIGSHRHHSRHKSECTCTPGEQFAMVLVRWCSDGCGIHHLDVRILPDSLASSPSSARPLVGRGGIVDGGIPMDYQFLPSSSRPMAVPPGAICRAWR